MAKLCCWSLGINISLQLYRPTGLLTLEDLYAASHTSFLEKTDLTKRARMSKITNDGLTRSGAGCFIMAVPRWQQWATKG